MPILGKIGPPEAALRPLKLSASTVLEVENSRSEFWLEIKILLYKSTSGNTKMASEFELVAKQKVFISKIPQFFSGSRNQLISLIIFFCLATNSNSDAIFVFPEVDLYNRILIWSQNSDLEFSTSSTVEAKALKASRAAAGGPTELKNGIWPSNSVPQLW